MDNSNLPVIPQDNFIVLEDNLADMHDEKVVLDENTIILTSGDTYSQINMPALRAAFRKTGKSYEDIAEERDISVSSVYKFFSQKSKSPSFYNVIMIMKSCGVSVDDICGITPSSDNSTAAQIPKLTEAIFHLQALVESQQKMIEYLLHDLNRSDEY
jgi:DNA-binding phage protein